MAYSFEECSTVDEVIGQAVGAGSLCWLPRPDGVFHDQEATEIVDAAVRRVHELQAQPGTVAPERGKPERTSNLPNQAEQRITDGRGGIREAQG